MARLIDADALWAEAMEYADTGIEFDGEGVANFIANAPTVDAVPMVHGRWNRVKFFVNATLHHCSICDHAEIKKYNYCPNCGADMRDGDGNV